MTDEVTNKTKKQHDYYKCSNCGKEYINCYDYQKHLLRKKPCGKLTEDYILKLHEKKLETLFLDFNKEPTEGLRKKIINSLKLIIKTNKELTGDEIQKLEELIIDVNKQNNTTINCRD